MRSKALITVMVGMVLASCVSQDAAPVKAALDYQLICDGSTGCYGLMSRDKRVVKSGVDGQEGLSMSCTIGEKASDLTFTLSGKGFSISLESVASDKNKTCTINATDESNTYAKNCVLTEGGKADCSEDATNGADVDAPCQVSVTQDGSTVTGTICCRYFPMQGHETQNNEYSLASSKDPSEPASFEFKYCK
jgi:hypothetical protein